IVVATIVPNHDAALLGDRVPPVAVSVGFLEGDFLRELAKKLSLDEVAVEDGVRLVKGKVGVELPMLKEGPRSWLTWKPRRPGTEMLYRLLPALAGVAIFIGVVGFLMLRHAQRSNDQLAESERRATELAFRDALTGLGNRAQLIETLTQALPRLQAGEHLA